MFQICVLAMAFIKISWTKYLGIEVLNDMLHEFKIKNFEIINNNIIKLKTGKYEKSII